MESKTSLTDDQGNMRWQQLLRAFKAIIDKDPSPEKVKESLTKLKQTAASDAHLTARQVEGIAARCDNYMKGEYGNTKTDANLAHGATTATK